MQSLRDAHPWLAQERILEMATVNGARALNQAQALGKIRAGFQADLIALPIESESGDVFEKVVAWDKEVPWMMLAGVESPRDA